MGVKSSFCLLSPYQKLVLAGHLHLSGLLHDGQRQASAGVQEEEEQEENLEQFGVWSQQDSSQCACSEVGSSGVDWDWHDSSEEGSPAHWRSPGGIKDQESGYPATANKQPGAPASQVSISPQASSGCKSVNPDLM